jgi:hypothetical protein
LTGGAAAPRLFDMGWLTRLVDRIDAKLDKPADQSVLTDPTGGSERILQSDDPDQQRAAAASARSNRNRMRHRWLGGPRS